MLLFSSHHLVIDNSRNEKYSGTKLYPLTTIWSHTVDSCCAEWCIQSPVCHRKPYCAQRRANIILVRYGWIMSVGRQATIGGG